jgi:hypothetical protein
VSLLDELRHDACARGSDKRHFAQRTGRNEITNRYLEPGQRLGRTLVAELAALGWLHGGHLVEHRGGGKVVIG